MPSWVADYLAIPFAHRGRDRSGCDCWGLARLVWRERCGLELPEGAGYASAHDAARVGAVIERGLTEDWQAVAASAERPLDGVLLTGIVGQGRALQRAAMHVGVVVAPGWLLHIGEGAGVTVEGYGPGGRMRRRVVGFYRHRALAGSPAEGASA